MMNKKTDRLEFVMNEIKSLLKIHTPLELIFFPSAGYTTALNKIIMESSITKWKEIFIDIDINFIEDFTSDVHPFFDILVKKSLQTSFDRNNIELNFSDTTISVIHECFNWAVKNNKCLIFVFKNVGLNRIYQEHFFIDLIHQLNSLRSISPSNLNYITANFYPIYLKNTKGGLLPILPKFFNLHTFKSEAKDTIENAFKDFDYLDFTKNDIENFNNITGGIIGIVKSLLRDLKLQNLKLSSITEFKLDSKFFELFENTSIRIEQILSFYPAEYTVVLSKIVASILLDDKEDMILKFFEKMGIIQEKHIFSRIFEAYIKTKGISTPILNITDKSSTKVLNFIKINNNVSLDQFTYEIIINGQRSGLFLTNTEFQILDKLIKKEGNLLSRDEIAEIIWGKNYLEKYSDWAIDKTISRIREKIKDQRPYQTLITLKGRGIIIKNI